MRYVLIGVGMVADTYVKAISESDTLTLHGVYSRSVEKCTDFAYKSAALLGYEPKVYQNIDEIAEDPDAQAIIVATPPNARKHLVDRMVAVGKPLLLEKPIERNTQAANDIVQACESSGTPLTIMLQQRARTLSKRLKARLLTAEFGPVALVRIDVPWWRDQSYYDEPGRGSYERDGGGVMISQAIHTMDLALWLVGDVETVQGQIGTTILHSMEAEDTATASLQFASGAQGSLTVTTAAFPGAAESIEIHCAKASIRLTSGTLDIDWQDGKQEQLTEPSGTGGGADPMAFPCDWHKAVLEDFASTVAAGREPTITGPSALKVHQLIDAIADSSRNGKRVVIENSTRPPAIS